MSIGTEHLKGKKLFIGVPNSQPVVPSLFFWSVMGIRPIIPSVLKRAGQSTSAIRNNVLIRTFLDSDCDYYIKLDVDQTYPPNYFTAMIPLLEEYKCIGPLIFDRWQESKFVPLVWEQPARKTVAKTGIEEVPFLHSNCFFHREVLEAISPPWFDVAITRDGLNKTFHGDRHFMGKVPEAGYKIYVNYDVVVKHLAEIEIDRDIYERWNNTI